MKDFSQNKTIYKTSKDLSVIRSLIYYLRVYENFHILTDVVLFEDLPSFYV